MNNDAINLSEQIVRLLHRDWIVEGVLQATAFVLDNNETYLSVNRLSINSFQSDVAAFLSKHPMYKVIDNGNQYNCAELYVAAVCNISTQFNSQLASLSVEVEPRNAHIPSHAGIFTRINGKNIKGGDNTEYKTDDEKTISSDVILLKVRMQLLHLSELKTCAL